MIETNLVPIDVSEEEAGATALKLAADLAGKYGSKLVLLNVVEQVPAYVAAQLPAGLKEKAVSDARTRLKEITLARGAPRLPRSWCERATRPPEFSISRMKQAPT